MQNPAGTLEAIHVQPKTDATVGFVEWVYLVAPGNEPKGKPVFVADKVDQPLKLRWSGNMLTITADRARVFKLVPTTVVRTQSGDITASLEVVIAEPVI